MFLARSRVSGEIGGILLVIGGGLLAGAILSAIINLLKDHVFKTSDGAKKVLGILNVLVWLAALALIALDLSGVFPFIRNTLLNLI